MDIPVPVRSLKISKEWPLLNPQTKRLLEIGQNNTPPLSSLCSLDIYKHPVHGSAITAAKNRVITYLLILVCVNDPCLKESCRQDTLNMSTFAASSTYTKTENRSRQKGKNKKIICHVSCVRC